MKKRSAQGDTVSDEPGAIVENLVHAAGDLLRAAGYRVGPVAAAAGESIEQAAERLTPLVVDAAGRVGPLTTQALGKAGPLAQQAAGAVGPYAALVRERGVKAGHDAAERIGPALGSARDRVRAATRTAAPVVVVEPPRKKGRWLTALAVATAAGGAAFVVARRRSADQGAQWQAARPSTPYVPPAPSATSAPSAGTTGGASAAADLTTSSAREDAVGTDLSGAQSTETAEMYGQPIGDRADGDVATDAETEMTARVERQADADEEVPPVPSGSDATEGLNVVTLPSSGPSTSDATETRSPEPQSGPPAAGNAVLTEGESPSAHESHPGRSGDSYHSGEPVDEDLGSTAAHDTAIGGEGPVSTEDDNSAGVGPDAHPGKWTEHGAYVGVEPPEGYTIKANERSMKYHLPESGGYNRTLSMIWFSSEEAAQDAGFVRAQR